MSFLDELLSLDELWRTTREDDRSWMIASDNPSLSHLTVLRSLQPNGIVPWFELTVSEQVSLRVSHNSLEGLDSLHEFWESWSTTGSLDILELALEVAELVTYQASNQEVSSKLVQLIAACKRDGMQVHTHALIDKSRMELRDLSPWAVSVWFNAGRFYSWLAASQLSKAFRFLATDPPRLVLLPAVETGAPKWIRSFQLLSETTHRDELLREGERFRQRWVNELRQLTAQSDGSVFLGVLLDDAAPHWILRHPPFPALAAVSVLGALSSSYKMDPTGFTWSPHVRSRTLWIHESLTLDGVSHSSGKHVTYTEDVIVSWLEFLRYHIATCDEAKRHKAIWSQALDHVLADDTPVLSQTVRMTEVFRKLRDNLLDDNLEKALSSAEKAHAAVMQLAGQIIRDVDSLGGEAEKLAVAGITSGLLSIAGVAVRSVPIAILGPIATALVFMWLFPLMLGRLDYLEASVNRRQQDLVETLRSIKKSAGDLVSEDLFMSQLQPHRDAADKAIRNIREHLVQILLVLNLITISVTTYFTATSKWSPLSFLTASVVVCYALWGVIYANIPEYHKHLLAVSALLVILSTIIGPAVVRDFGL